MNPEQLAKSGTEHAEQMALFCWANKACEKGFHIANDMRMYAPGQHHIGAVFSPVPVLKWLHAIPNAGARGNKVAAAQLKAEGVKAGVADIFLPVVKIRSSAEREIEYAGLYIELKRANGKQTDFSKEQLEFRDFVESQGYMWRGCFGWRNAAQVIQEYLS